MVVVVKLVTYLAANRAVLSSMFESSDLDPVHVILIRGVNIRS